MRRYVLVWTLLAWVAAPGCVTPQPVKDASAQHSANLVALEGAVRAERDRISVYYDDLVELQKRSFVAQAARAEIDAIVDKAADAPPPATDSRPSQDNFVKESLALTNLLRTKVDEFNGWMSDDWPAPGLKTIDEKKARFREMADSAADPRRKANFLRLADRSDDELTFVVAAKNLRTVKRNLNAELDILLAQIDVMKQVHGVVHAYLSVDATIDASKIAAAAAAGATLDLSKMPELANVLAAARGGSQ